MVWNRMVKGQNLVPRDVSEVIDQLERHCLAPDGSLISIPFYNDLQLARDQMCTQRLRYLQAFAIYSEAIAMVEEYHHAALYPPFPFRISPQIYEALDHLMVVAEAAQRLKLPLISEDSELHIEDIEKLSVVSRSSVDSTSTSDTINSSTNPTNYATPKSSFGGGANSTFSAVDPLEPGVGGVPTHFLGITPAYLCQTQLHQTPLSMDMTEYCMAISREIESRLKVKCDKLSDALVLDEIDSLSSGSHSTSSRLPERVKLMIEEIEREEAALQEDLYSADRKFTEYYNVHGIM